MPIRCSPEFSRMSEAVPSFTPSLSDAILVGTPTDGISRKARAVSLVRAADAEFDLEHFPAAATKLDEVQKYLADLRRATPADASLAELTTEATRLREEIQKKVP